MEMRVNRDLIKKLRIQKSWSQDKLADQAGVSMRTIQRIETEGVASLQSRTSIAQAFGIDPSVLLLEQPTPTAQDLKESSVDRDLRQTYFGDSWRSYIRTSLRFSILSLLWVGMITTAFLIFTTLVSGIFLWEGTSMTFLQSAGGGMIGAATFAPIFFLLHYAYRRLTRLKKVSAKP